MKYVHRDTSLGPIAVRRDGLEVNCTVTVLAMRTRGPSIEHELEFMFQNMSTDHESGMEALVHGALAKGKSLADAYIAARESQPAGVVSEPKDFSKRTTIFACGQPAGRRWPQREFEVYVQDYFDPAIRRLTLATRIGTPDESHLVLQSHDLKGFLEAMAGLQATPFSHRGDDEEAA